MAVEVLDNSCNMYSGDLPDMYALDLWVFSSQALGIYIRQIPRAHVTTIAYKDIHTCMHAYKPYVYMYTYHS